MNTNFEDLADELSGALEESRGMVSGSVSDMAQSITQGTHDLMNNIAISDETIEPTEVSEISKSMQPIRQLPGIYQPQAPEEPSHIPVLVRLQGLRA